MEGVTPLRSLPRQALANLPASRLARPSMRPRSASGEILLLIAVARLFATVYGGFLCPCFPGAAARFRRAFLFAAYSFDTTLPRNRFTSRWLSRHQPTSRVFQRIATA